MKDRRFGRFELGRDALTNSARFGHAAITQLLINSDLVDVESAQNHLSENATNQELVHAAVSRVRLKSPENADFGHLWAIPKRAR